jgi:L-threonylcarbamoyladenylate synthase
LAVEYSEYIAILRRGGVVACPTETFYGLLADAGDTGAVLRVVAMKGRGAGDPIAVLLPSVDSVSMVASEFPDAARRLADEYWPGPLTLLLRAVEGLPGALTRHGRIGVRVPGPSPALDLVRAFGGPLTATSANRTGQPAAGTDAEVRESLGEEVDGVVPGAAPGGLPSTVVDVTRNPPRVIRAGAVLPESKNGPGR